MSVTATAVLVTLGIVTGGLWWCSSGRHRRPCPASLAWLLENPYTNAVAGSSAVLDRLELGPGMRVLDAGSGPGRLSIPAAHRVGPTGEVVALDLQEAMLRGVRSAADRRGLTNIRTVQGDIESCVAKTGSFDRVLLVTVLGEVPDPASAMRALHAVLRTDGLLSVTEMLPDPDYQRRGTVRRLAEAAGFRFDRSYGTWLAFTMNFRKPPA